MGTISKKGIASRLLLIWAKISAGNNPPVHRAFISVTEISPFLPIKKSIPQLLPSGLE